ncbi:MAG TPA: M23 family metallopeptidase [Micromonosporaceae bacterium]|nr:M23 family metallopeptidase [Micromonosporaceae bacterium]
MVPAVAEATVVPSRRASPVVGPVPFGSLSAPTGMAGVHTSADPAPAAGFRWPLDDLPRVVRRFDPPPQPWLPGHRGVDLAAVPGAVVRSAGAGVVHFAGRIADRGVVSVSHLGGLRTTYEPVEPVVAAGDPVGAGDPIGLLVAGHPGCSAPACLHWGLRRGEEYLDPLSLLGLGRVRLLPTRVQRRRRRYGTGPCVEPPRLAPPHKPERRSVRSRALAQARGWA